MKKIFLLLVMLPTILFSQENLKSSAEGFMAGYFKLFEEKNWDIIPKVYAEDAQLIFPDGKILSLQEAMNPYMEKNKKETISMKIDVKWMQTDVTGPNTVMVTTNLIETTKRIEGIQVFDYVEVFLLERAEDIWKIKKYVANWNFPLIYNENIEKKYQIGNMSAIAKLDGAIDQIWYAMFYDIEYFKKNGTPPAEYGKMMGTMYVKTWDKSKGFDGLCSGLIWNCEILFKYVEVMERNETTLKVRLIPPDISEKWNFTREELLNYSRNIWLEIADYMGATTTTTEDGKYWIVTMKKK